MKTCRKMICLLLSVSLLACMVIPAFAGNVAEHEAAGCNLLEAADGINGISCALLSILQESNIDSHCVCRIDVVSASSGASVRAGHSSDESFGAIVVVAENENNKEIAALIPMDAAGVPMTTQNIIDLGLQSSYEFTGGVLVAKYSQYMYQDSLGSEVYVNPRSVSVKTTSAAVLHMEARYYVHGDLYQLNTQNGILSVSAISDQMDIEGELRVIAGSGVSGTAPVVGQYYTQNGSVVNNYYLYPFTATNRQILRLTAMGGAPLFMLTVGYYDTDWNYYEYQVDYPR